MSAVPPVSRRVLDAIRSAAATDSTLDDPTPVTRAFVRLEVALDAYAVALAVLDRIEEAVVAAHGYPRVPLPDAGSSPAYAADTATIRRRLGPGPASRRLAAELRRRQATFARAAEAAGLDTARAVEGRAAKDLSTAATDLLLAPAEARADLALKLAVLIAAGEVTAEDALAFPWAYLRTLLTEMTA